MFPFAVLIMLGSVTPLTSASRDWLETARVFLIDGYQYPLVPELTFDAKKTAEAAVDMHANILRMVTMGVYCTIPGVPFDRHPDQGDRDLLAEMIAEAKPRGLRVIAYISTNHSLAATMVQKRGYGQVARPGGGPRVYNHYAGENVATVCINTEYRNAYLSLVRKVVNEYDIDGLYFDTWEVNRHYLRPAACYCRGCVSGFRDYSGKALPYRENSNDYTQVELWVFDEYYHWKKRVVLYGVLQEVKRIVQDSGKDLPMIYNINNPERMAREDPRFVDAMDAFLYERGDTMLERAEGVSLARSMGKSIWPYIGSYDHWPAVPHSGVDYSQEIYTTIMFTGGTIIAQPYPFIDYPNKRYLIREPYNLQDRHVQYYSGFRNLPHVAVVYGFETPPGHGRTDSWWEMNTRWATLGAFGSCLYRHLQVSSVIYSTLDDPEKLAQYKVLYLADVPYLSPQQIANVEQFVFNGGGLVVSRGASLFSEDLQRQDRFALEDLIHVRPVKLSGSTRVRLEEHYFNQGAPGDQYLKLRPGNGAIDGNLDPAYVPLWYYEPVEVLPGGTVAADVVLLPTGETVLPGVVVNRHGKGKVVYLASALGSLYVQANMRELAEFINLLVDWVSPEPAPYTVQAPEALITNMTGNGDTRILHMTNWMGNKLERKWANEYTLMPVTDVRVQLRVPVGKRVKRVHALVDSPIHITPWGECIDIFLPRVDAYQAIVMELE